MSKKGILDRSMGFMGKEKSFKTLLPNLLVALGVLVGGGSYLWGSIYTNILLGISFMFLFSAWLIANLQNKEQLQKENRWNHQVKAMMAMGLCVFVGFAMLTYYEMQMPKYHVAMSDKELYVVPPQLNTKQLRKLGAECNTYGNTLCSHAVFAKIAKSDPRDFFALANLAMAQTHLGFHDHAVVNFERAIRSGMKKYDVYKFYGRSLALIGQKEKAIAAYRASLKLNPYQDSIRKQIEKLSEK